MTVNIDTSAFTTARQFDDAISTVRLPIKPTKPERTIQESDYPSKSDFYRALADATENYEAEQIARSEELNKYYEVKNAISDDFRKFAIAQYLDDGIPEHIANMVYGLAYDRGHSGGYEEVFNVMSSYADLATAAFFAGQESSK